MNKDNLINCISNMFDFKIFNSVLYQIHGNHKFNKLACFDLDYTLIKPKSKNKFPKDENDYIFLPNVIDKLKKLYDNKYNIVIFSNQSGKKINEVLIKLKKILFQLLPIKIDIIISTENDYYRKPHTGMFELYLQLINTNIKQFNDIFYCGDAAGRKNDFACSDYAFAHNLSLKYFNNINTFKFFTPEAFFNNNTVPLDALCINNIKNFSNNYQYINIPNINQSKNQEIILMCGFPGSGKSTIANNLVIQFKNYIKISKDEYKTKSLSLIKKSLNNRQSIIIDDTNIDIKTRKQYILLAQENNINIRCIHVLTDINICKHLNDMRLEISKGEYKKVPEIVYNVLNKKYEKPSEDEGFNNIINIPFILNKDIPKEFYFIYNNLI